MRSWSVIGQVDAFQLVTEKPHDFSDLVPSLKDLVFIRRLRRMKGLNLLEFGLILGSFSRCSYGSVSESVTSSPHGKEVLNLFGQRCGIRSVTHGLIADVQLSISYGDPVNAISTYCGNGDCLVRWSYLYPSVGVLIRR